MRRRDFVMLVSGGLAAGPLRALAQQPGKIWRIGFIAHTYEKFYGALFEGLRERGYVEGRNIAIEWRFTEGRAEQLPSFFLKSAIGFRETCTCGTELRANRSCILVRFVGVTLGNGVLIIEGRDAVGH